jgi:hypothetical protein
VVVPLGIDAELGEALVGDAGDAREQNEGERDTDAADRSSISVSWVNWEYRPGLHGGPESVRHAAATERALRCAVGERFFESDPIRSSFASEGEDNL